MFNSSVLRKCAEQAENGSLAALSHSSMASTLVPAGPLAVAKTFGQEAARLVSATRVLRFRWWVAGVIAIVAAIAAVVLKALESGMSHSELALLVAGMFCALLIRMFIFVREIREQADLLHQAETEQDNWRRERHELQSRVWRRTAQYICSHQALQVEVAERKKAEAALRGLSGRLLRLQDEERRRIARELHDSTSQNLVMISMNIAYMQADVSASARTRALLLDCCSLVEQCSKEIRTISYLLHPPILDELGLAAALCWAASGFSRRTGIQVELNVSENLGRFDRDVEMAMFRIVQEALTNIHRHSQSRTATISASRDQAVLTVSVEDQGRGFFDHTGDAGCDVASSLGVGIAGMRERIRQLKGELQIRSSDRGTRIVARVPVAECATELDAPEHIAEGCAKEHRFHPDQPEQSTARDVA